MRIRSALGALCGALALTAGLVVSAGTAGATVLTPGPHGHGGGPPDGSCTASTAGGTCSPTTFPNGHPLPSGYTPPVCTAAAGATTCSEDLTGLPHVGGNFGPGFHPGFPGGFGNNGLGLGGLGLGGLNLLNGNTIILGDGQQVDVCQYPSWQPFYSHWGAHFGGLRDQLNELRYQQLLQQANCGNSLNGINLLNGNLIDLGGLGVLGGGTTSVCSYNTWNDFNGWGAHRFGGHWGGFGSHWGGALGGNGWNQLRLRAHCQPQIVVIPGGTTTVEQAPPVPSDPPTAVAPAPAAPAPAPLTGSGNYRYPDTAPPTGDGSLAGR